MKFEELLTNVEFNQQVAAAKDAQEVVDLFAAKGIEVPMEIAHELFEQPNGDLSEDDLDLVAGGALGGAIVGGVVAYVASRIAGKSKSESAKTALKHAYYGYTKLSW